MRFTTGSPVMMYEYPPPQGPRGRSPPLSAYCIMDDEISSCTSGQPSPHKMLRFHWVSQNASELYIWYFRAPSSFFGSRFILNTASVKVPSRLPEVLSG